VSIRLTTTQRHARLPVAGRGAGTGPQRLAPAVEAPCDPAVVERHRGAGSIFRAALPPARVPLLADAR
jgi:hypothetical protein